MPTGTTIERKAEDAKRTLLEDRRGGEEQFAKLLNQNPFEAVVFLKRGEAWELAGELALSARDFRKAAQLFRDSQGQNLARQALERVGRRVFRRSEAVAEAMNRQLPDPSITKACREALEIAVQDPGAAVTRCRTVLEELVQHILRLNAVVYNPSTDLTSLFELLREKSLVEGHVLSHMQTIRVLGEDMRRGEPIAAEEALVAGTALLAILEEAFPPLRRPQSAAGRMPARKAAEAAALIYDSSSSPTAEGFRAAAGLRVWKRLYRKASFYVDIETDPPGELDHSSLVGQVLDAENHMAVPAARIVLRSGREAIAETTTNELGEFSLKYNEAKDLSFLVELKDGQRIVVPLSGPEAP